MTAPAVGGVRWIDRQPALDALLAELEGRSWVSIDTEFLTERSYFPRLCLLQIAAEGLVACVDPLAAGLELGPLWTLLRRPELEKLCHAGENDLAVLSPAVGAVLGPVFDTQIAAAFTGHGPSIGYGPLVERLCGVALDKGHARTDWSRRPLPREAVRYAAADVVHLRPMQQELAAELARLGRSGWAAEEFQALEDPARYRDDPGLLWRKVRGWQRLDEGALAVLRELAVWRESSARATNRPRRWVIGDEVLLEISRRRPADRAELAAVPGFDPRRHGAEVAAILAMVRHGAARAGEGPRPVRPDEAVRVERLRALVAEVAADLGLPDALLATVDDLLRLVRGEDRVRPVSGWRRDVVGTRLLAALGGI
jgi:ribonuclease D